MSEVVYTPTVIEVLRDAWIKYGSMLIVVWYVVRGTSSFLFGYGLVPAIAVEDGKGGKQL